MYITTKLSKNANFYIKIVPILSKCYNPIMRFSEQNSGNPDTSANSGQEQKITPIQDLEWLHIYMKNKGFRYLNRS